MNKRFLSIGLTALSILSILMLTVSTVQTRGKVAAASPRPQTATLADSQSQNQNNLPFPSRWSGNCDTNNYFKKSPQHLSAYPLLLNGVPSSYRGVVACGPRPLEDNVPDVPVQFF